MVDPRFYAQVVIDFVALWRSGIFQERALAWIDAVVEERGQVRVGPVDEFKIRFWSAVFRVPLQGQSVWFKVANPGQAFEGELLVALSQIVPGRVIKPWAIEPSQGWSLLPDGGPTLSWTSEDDWIGLIDDVAELQRRCRPHQSLLPMLPSYEVATAADCAEALVKHLAGLPLGHPQHLDRADAGRYLQQLPLLRNRMAVLEEAGPRPSLQPNDAHPGNAVHPTRPGQPRRLFDLGDAVWSHPWAVLHSPGRGVAGARLSDPWPQAASTQRLVDAYTEHWPEVDRTDRPVVLEAVERLGALHRLESWRRLIAEADPATEDQLKLRLNPCLEQAFS